MRVFVYFQFAVQSWRDDIGTVDREELRNKTYVSVFYRVK